MAKGFNWSDVKFPKKKTLDERVEESLHIRLVIEHLDQYGLPFVLGKYSPLHELVSDLVKLKKAHDPEYIKYVDKKREHERYNFWLNMSHEDQVKHRKWAMKSKGKKK